MEPVNRTVSDSATEWALANWFVHSFRFSRFKDLNTETAVVYFFPKINAPLHENYF